MFDLVPLARARRKMTDMNHQATLVRKLLQAKFPKTAATAVASATVRRDEKFLCIRVKFLAQMFPPTPNRFHRKLCGIVVNTDVHPSKILVQIVNAIRRRFAEFFVDEVVNLHQLRLAFRTPNSAVLPVISDQFLVLTVSK